MKLTDEQLIGIIDLLVSYEEVEGLPNGETLHLEEVRKLVAYEASLRGQADYRRMLYDLVGVGSFA
jgi:hypothetical protein